jgi:hypothetical protein
VRDESGTFTIIVGDLAGSRKIEDRLQLSKKIRQVIGIVSRRFPEEVYAPLVLTRGIDEISGVLKRPGMSYRICKLVNEGLFPHAFRFAVVNGNLDIDVSSKDAGRMDGVAFHSGANLIRQAKKENLHYIFNLGFQREDLNACLNQLTRLVHILRSEWTDHQRHVVRFYERLGNQKVAAKELGVTQQAVSDALRQAHWRELIEAEMVVDRLLEKGEGNKHLNL